MSLGKAECSGLKQIQQLVCLTLATPEQLLGSCSCTLERSHSRDVSLARAEKHLLSKVWMLEAVCGQCAVRCQALGPHWGSGVVQSVSNPSNTSVVFCTSLTSALPLGSFLPLQFLVTQCRRYGVGGGVFATDVNICAVEPEGMIRVHWTILQQLVQMLHVKRQT